MFDTDNRKLFNANVVVWLNLSVVFLSQNDQQDSVSHCSRDKTTTRAFSCSQRARVTATWKLGLLNQFLSWFPTTSFNKHLNFFDLRHFAKYLLMAPCLFINDSIYGVKDFFSFCAQYLAPDNYFYSSWLQNKNTLLPCLHFRLTPKSARDTELQGRRGFWAHCVYDEIQVTTRWSSRGTRSPLSSTTENTSASSSIRWWLATWRWGSGTTLAASRRDASRDGSPRTVLDLDDTLRTSISGNGLGLEPPWPWRGWQLFIFLTDVNP